MLTAMRISRFAVAVAVAWAVPAFAQKTPAAVSAWVAAPAAGAPAAVAYVVVDNPTMYDIYIISATADLAGKVEFRAGATGSAEPAPVAEFSVPAYGATAADRSAPHLRLLDLKKPIAAGDTVQLALTTDGGLVLKVAAPVK